MTIQIKKKIYEESKELFESLLKERLKKIILYGSFARNTETNESDIDIMVLTDLDENKIKKLNDDIINISVELSLKYNLVFSVIVLNIEHYKKYLDIIPFYENISREGVVLYEN